MEDFALDIMIGKGPSARSIRMDLPHFTLIGATTRAGMLTNPLRDRFGITFRLELYSPEQLAQIVKRSAHILRVEIDDGGALEIARRSRGTPRIANRMLKRVRDYAVVRAGGRISLEVAREGLDMLAVDALGLDHIDRMILRSMIEKFGGGPVGLDTLAAATGEDTITIEDVYEPYLLQLGFIMRTPPRPRGHGPGLRAHGLPRQRQRRAPPAAPHGRGRFGKRRGRTMNTKDFYYDLPQELIAQTPAPVRDESRLLVYHRASGEMEHRIFRDVIDYLNPGDALVINETRVLPARLIGEREDTGGAMEFLLLRRVNYDTWETLVKPGKRAKTGVTFSFGGGKLRATVLSSTEDGGRLVQFHFDGVFEEILDELGQMPLPPYITERLEDKNRYQTVYAKEEGSAAAPTAGLHFTPELLERIRQKGVDVVPVLLHVGLGTFRPVKEERVEDHHMHSEYYMVTPEAADRLNAARRRGGRIVCVGTTSVRTLETVATEDGVVHPGSGWTQIFIMPGYRYKAVDALITNFHLPESTLLMLVSAFMGRENALHMYETAVQMRYRFFSFGDATLLL